MIYKIERDDDERPQDEKNIPNDYPIPNKYPDDESAPVKEPNRGPFPGKPMYPPVKEPNKNPRIRVLNLQP